MKKIAEMLPTPRLKYELHKVAREGGRVLMGYDSLVPIEAAKIMVDDLPIETRIVIINNYSHKASIAIYTKKTAGSILRTMLLQFKDEKVDPLFELLLTMVGTERFGEMIDSVGKLVPCKRRS